jgi:hypothetical protein
LDSARLETGFNGSLKSVSPRSDVESVQQLNEKPVHVQQQFEF